MHNQRKKPFSSCSDPVGLLLEKAKLVPQLYHRIFRTVANKAGQEGRKWKKEKERAYLDTIRALDFVKGLELKQASNQNAFGTDGILICCLGAPLARMEAQIAINMLLNSLHNLRLKGPAESLRWRPSLILRGLEALPMEFH